MITRRNQLIRITQNQRQILGKIPPAMKPSRDPTATVAIRI
jgi:hypothetical protein